MEQFIIYASIIVGLFLLGVVGVYIKRRFNELDTIKQVLDIVNYITKQIEFKHKEDVTKIVEYVLEAIEFIDLYEATNDLQIRRELVTEKALMICEREGVDLGDGSVVEIVNMLVEYIVSQQ